MPKTDNKKTPLDLSTLAPVEAEVPKVARERKHKDNPFVAWLAESYENKTGKAVTIPNGNVAEVEYLIRRAADELGIGARVVKTEASKTTTTVTFAGKDRKARKTKNADADASA